MAKITDSPQRERIILGIDPGTQVLGYGVIKCVGGKQTILSIGIVKLEKLADHGDRLKRIFERCTSLIESYQPTEMALEAPFFGKNIQSMLKLGRAQGVAMSAGLMKGLSIAEYAPRKIKQSITGNGNASKEQVAIMLQSILKFDKMPKYLDATDGLAVAFCHFMQTNKAGMETSAPKKKITKSKPGQAWSAFVKSNPERIKSGNNLK